MRIGVAGISGRMGQLIAEEVPRVAHLAGGIARGGDLAALIAACDVLIDFTHATCVEHHAAAIAGSGTAWVLGTTGLTHAGHRAVDAAARQSAVVQAANFSTGVNLVLGLARLLGGALPAEEFDAEILEMHHRAKVDAPSGTALAIGQAVAEGRRVALASVAQSGRDGQTGARKLGAIGFAALRGGAVVGEHSLLFAGESEHIAITHKALDRRVFARGAVRAALWTKGRPPGLYGMNDVLGLTESLDRK